MKKFRYTIQYPAFVGVINLNVLFKYEGWRHPTTKASHYLDQLEIIEFENPDIDLYTINMDNSFDDGLYADVKTKLLTEYTNWKEVIEL